MGELGEKWEPGIAIDDSFGSVTELYNSIA